MPRCGCLARLNGGPQDWGLTPTRTVTPNTAAEAAQALADCARSHSPVWAVGAASRLAACPPVPSQAVVLATAGLARVVSYDPADLTITVQGGAPLEAIHDLLLGHDQELPGAHFGLGGGTIGGALATNLAGARRSSGGPLRDRILGMEIATTDGLVTKSGGRVVKNVAGYDVGRLIAGAHGALALITEVTLRLSPRPEAHAPFERAFADVATATEAALAVARDAPAVGYAAVIATGGEVRASWVHEGDTEVVAEGVRWSEARHGAARAEDAHDHNAPVESRLALGALEHVCPERSNVLLRVGVRPSALIGILPLLTALGATAVGGHLGHGAAFARFDSAASDAPACQREACALIERAGGWWRWQGAWHGDGPGAMPFGGIDVPWDLYARIVGAFDAAGVLGPDVFRRGAPAGSVEATR